MTARQRESVSNKSTNKEEVKNDKPKENKNPFKGRFNPKYFSYFYGISTFMFLTQFVISEYKNDQNEVLMVLG
jgi:hypothetical protein